MLARRYSYVSSNSKGLLSHKGARIMAGVLCVSVGKIFYTTDFSFTIFSASHKNSVVKL